MEIFHDFRKLEGLKQDLENEADNEIIGNLKRFLKDSLTFKRIICEQNLTDPREGFIRVTKTPKNNYSPDFIIDKIKEFYSKNGYKTESAGPKAFIARKKDNYRVSITSFAEQFQVNIKKSLYSLT